MSSLIGTVAGAIQPPINARTDVATFKDTKLFSCTAYALRDIGQSAKGLYERARSKRTYLIRASDSKAAVGLADIVLRADNQTSGAQVFHENYTEKGLYDIECTD